MWKKRQEWRNFLKRKLIIISVFFFFEWYITSLQSMAELDEISRVQSHFFDKCNEHLDKRLVHAFAILCRLA